MTPTPAQLRNPILASIGKLTNFQVGVEVSSNDVTNDVLACLGYTPDDMKKARNNVNFAATQTLRDKGMLAPLLRRGMWALSQDGVAAARAVACVKTETPEVPVACVPVPTISEWDDDIMGSPVFTTILQDSYAGDNYIKVLGISQVRCFGGFRESSSICLTCPVAGSCQAHQFKSFSEVAARLNQRAATLNDGTPHIVPVKSSVVRDDSLADIMFDMEHGSKPAPKPKKVSSHEMTASVDSVCYRCNGSLYEGSTVIFDTGKGVRHKHDCVVIKAVQK